MFKNKSKDSRLIPRKLSFFIDISLIMNNNQKSDFEITQAELKKKEFQQKAILDNIPDIAWLKDLQGRFIAVNLPFAKACGFKIEEIVGKTDLDIWPRDLALEYRADDQQVIDSKKRKCVQERLASRENGEQWIETIKTPFFDADNNVIGTTGIARNITLQKNEAERLKEIRAELELRVKVRTAELVSSNEALRKEFSEHKAAELNLANSEIKFKTIFEQSKIGMVVAELSTRRFILTNKAFQQMLGYSSEELDTLDVMDIHPKESLPLVMEKFDQIAKGELIVVEDLAVLKKDKSIIYCDVNSSPFIFDKRKCVLGNFIDITERKKYEDKILSTLSLQEATLEASTDGILVVDLKGRVISHNRRFLKLWNVPDSLMASKNDKLLLEYVADQLVDPKGFIHEVQRLYGNVKEVSSDVIVFKDGQILERFSIPQKIKDNIIGRVWSFRDVTQKIAYEKELKLYREKLEILVEQRTKSLELEILFRKEIEEKADSLHKQLEFILGATKTGLDIIDQDYNLRYVDTEWARIYGDWTGKKCYEYFMNRKTACSACSVREVFRTKKIIVTEEKLIKEGNRPIQVTSIPFKDKNNEWLVAEVNVDMTEKNKIDEQLQQHRNHLEQLVDKRTQELLEETKRYKNSEFQKNKMNQDLIKINDKLKSISLIDAHTGLYNYRYLQEAIEVEFHRARRYAQNLTIIMLDIDYFKSINDVYGVAFGDLVLKQLSKQLKRMVRRDDILVRYGGEEFIIISPRLNRTVGFNMAQRLLDALNFFNFGNKEHKIRLKISFSVASFPDDRAKNGVDLINLGNLLLNKAKENGGNRVSSSLDLLNLSGKKSSKISKKVGIKNLKNTIDKLNRQSKQGLSESIFAFAKTLELKDHYTGEHVENTVHFAISVAKELNLSKEDVELIKQASMLHDLGKIGISENILLKKGKLTKKEFTEIKRHPQIGADIIRPIQFLHDLVPFIFYHHERWDGKGYPAGIKGEDIPLGARIIAIADVYQALTSERPYHRAFAKSVAVDIIKKSSGTQFDPRIVAAFLKVVSRKK